jgi:L-rhamnose mutarotase
LKPGRGEEYDRLHRSVWPEVVSQLSARGAYDYSIFRREELVISVIRTREVVESPHNEKSTAASAAEWTAVLAPLFEATSDDDGEPLWADRVFRLD